MPHQQNLLEDEAPQVIPSEERAVEFDFGVRAPMRAHVAACMRRGWKPNEIALAFAEMADELMLMD